MAVLSTVIAAGTYLAYHLLASPADNRVRDWVEGAVSSESGNRGVSVLEVRKVDEKFPNDVVPVTSRSGYSEGVSGSTLARNAETYEYLLSAMEQVVLQRHLRRTMISRRIKEHGLYSFAADALAFSANSEWDKNISADVRQAPLRDFLRQENAVNQARKIAVLSDFFADDEYQSLKGMQKRMYATFFADLQGTYLEIEGTRWREFLRHVRFVAVRRESGKSATRMKLFRPKQSTWENVDWLDNLIYVESKGERNRRKIVH